MRMNCEYGFRFKDTGDKLGVVIIPIAVGMLIPIRRGRRSPYVEG